MQCEHKLVPKVFVDFCDTFKMASRPRRLNCEEVLQELFAERDSDLSEESELESEWDVSVISSRYSIVHHASDEIAFELAIALVVLVCLWHSILEIGFSFFSCFLQ